MVAVKLAISDLIRTFKSLKTWVIILLGFFFFADAIMDIRGLAREYQLGITPYMYPIFIMQWRGRMYALVLIVMMLGDAPFFNGAEVFISMRASKYKWFFGKILYIVLCSMVFQVIMILLSIIVCFPYNSLSTEWGDLISTYVKMGQGAISANGAIDTWAIMLIGPMTAMLYEFVLMILISIIIGISIFLLNGVMKNNAGTFLIGVGVMVDLYLTDLAADGICSLQYYMPTTWVDINNICAGGELSFENSVIRMLLIIIVLSLVTVIMVAKNIIRPYVKK